MKDSSTFWDVSEKYRFDTLAFVENKMLLKTRKVE